jgi:hypothetical protein
MAETQLLVDLERRIPLESVWIHRASGGRYQVKDHHEGADGYENGAPLTVRIGYVQLEDGQIRKAGARYSRGAADFLKEFDPAL